jgi:hypothetical protein
MVVVIAFVLAQAASPAQASHAAPVCTDGSTYRTNVWERAKSPDLRRYCDLLASASSKLAGPAPMATAALDAAREAEVRLPGMAITRVLEARALATLGRAPEALGAFEEARSRDPRSLDEPVALRAFARVLAATGHDVDASRVYRALAPRASTLAPGDRTAIAIEGGLEAMLLGPDTVGEAVADFREALRGAQGDEEKFVVLALALALDRSGNRDEATTLLAERGRTEPRGVVAAWGRRSAVPIHPSEAAALSALALETSDPAGARDGWEEGLRLSPDGPWSSYARDRVAALRAGPTTRRPR